MCNGCKYFVEDMSVNACDCKKVDKLTLEEFERFFGDDEEGCPYREEEDYTAENEYYNSLMNEKLIIEIPKECYNAIQENPNACEMETYDCLMIATRNGKRLEDTISEIQDDLLEYHRAFVMAGRSDLASVVANCLDKVLKHTEEIN